MSKKSSSDNSTSEEISPEVVAVITRAKRSFMFSIGLLVVGLISVALVIIFKSGNIDENVRKNISKDKESLYELGMIIVPSEAKIISSVPSSGLIGVTYEIEGKVKLRLIDGTTGSIIRDIDFIKE